MRGSEGGTALAEKTDPGRVHQSQKAELLSAIAASGVGYDVDV